MEYFSKQSYNLPNHSVNINLIHLKESFGNKKNSYIFHAEKSIRVELYLKVTLYLAS